MLEKKGKKDPIAGYQNREVDRFGYQHFGHEVVLINKSISVLTRFFGGFSIHKLDSYKKAWKSILDSYLLHRIL